MESYPDALTAPTQQSYGREAHPGAVQAQPQSGDAYLVKQTTDDPRVYNLQWAMPRYQAVLFDLWWREGLKNGSLSFTLDLLDETGKQNRECKFTDKPELDRVTDGFYFYSATVYARAL